MCGVCWTTVIPLAGGSCPCCGSPAEDAAEACLHCRGDPPPQLATVVWGEYDGALRAAVLALKHRGRDELAKPLGSRLAALVAVQSWSADIDVVAHVPSHPVRRLRHGWTAARALAEIVGQRLDRPRTGALRRHGLRRQARRSRARRLRLPMRSFSCSRSLEGLRLLLVDDVTTTGTTLRRAAAALKRSGAKEVFCAAMALTPSSRRVT